MMRSFLPFVNTTLLSTSLFNVKYEQNMQNLHNFNPLEVLNLCQMRCHVINILSFDFAVFQWIP